MMTADEYIAIVIDRMPVDTPMRRQIADELRAHIDERTRQGHALADILQQLGDPEKLAESYVAAIPLDVVPFGTRAAAKIIDAMLAIVPVAILCSVLAPKDIALPALVVGMGLLACPIFMFYTIIAESRTSQTFGKRLMGTRVVREAGTRISIGQAIVRQLPWLFQIFWIDAFFALFTERHQRAFELLSKTRVVSVSTQEAVS
jgi:uncharacterized RDD family membrane protein YckC